MTIVQYRGTALRAVDIMEKHIKRASQSWCDDITRGNDKGLVVSGRPRCGKTLTAKAIVETTHRPLYVVGAGELATTPEEHLTSGSNAASKTADCRSRCIYTEEGFSRCCKKCACLNTTVSIFSGQPKYHQAILIFTTNLA